MMQKEYFKEALSDFTFEAANGGAVRHFAEKGYTVKQIIDGLDFPASYEKVQRAVWDFFLEKGVILLHEPGTAKGEKKKNYIKEYGKFGKISFRAITLSEDGQQIIDWKKLSCEKLEKECQINIIKEKHRKNGGETAYVSCDFGIIKKRDPKAYAAALSLLDDRQKEYAEGLPWADQRVYHCMDTRMTEIICRLLCAGQYGGSCYFMKLGEKVTIG